MTRRLDGYRSSAMGLLLLLVAIAAISPFVALTSRPARAEFRDVDIVDDEFEPPEIVIERGDTVVWIHRGGRPHGVRASDGSFESSPGCSFQNGGACMRSGDRYSRTFDQAGTFTYYCPVHGSANGVGMAGQVTVASGGGGGPTTTAAPPPTTQTTRPDPTTRPPTTAATTTQSPGTPATTQPPGSVTSTAAPVQEGSVTTLITLPSEADDTTTTLAAGVPINGNSGGDGDTNLLLGIAAAVVLAAAISATAWYYRAGARAPGGPPPGTPV